MREKILKSVAPIYLASGGFFLYSITLPMYRLSHYLLATAMSSAVYLVSTKFFPDKKIVVADEIKVTRTGERNVDEAIEKGKEYVKTLKALDERIINEKLSLQIQELQNVSIKIFNFITKNPTNITQIRTFMDYYYPTLLKLLETYADMENEGVKGENIRETLNKIEVFMDNIIPAFNNQLDKLYSDKALDIETDIKVLQSVLAQEGLVEEGMR